MKRHRLPERKKKIRHPYATVPKLWPGETFVCIGGGPSLTPEDVNYCRGKARVIAVNDAYKLAPWADVLYACDHKWWVWHNGVQSFKGPKYSLMSTNWPEVQRLENTGKEGLELEPHGVRNGGNSGYQALNLAFHLGAARMLLLGYDMQDHNGKTHWFGDHPQKSNRPFHTDRLVPCFNRLAPILKKHGVDVVNCTRRSALKCFPSMPITQALPAVMEQVAS